MNWSNQLHFSKLLKFKNYCFKEVALFRQTIFTALLGNKWRSRNEEKAKNEFIFEIKKKSLRILLHTSLFIRENFSINKFSLSI